MTSFISAQSVIMPSISEIQGEISDSLALGSRTASRINLRRENHPAIERHIERFSRPNNIAFIENSLLRAAPYLAFIMERIDYYGLPRELIYLPLVESGFRYAAVSHAGAVGMWQFMHASALPYGLVINEWQDDRRDVFLATDAALRKIRDELALLGGDPLLAMAAYNGGITRLRRHRRNLIAAGEEPTFWRMYDLRLLPRETMEYVPQILAIARMMQNPRRFGLTPLRWRPVALNQGREAEFAEIVVQQQVSLERLATELNMDMVELGRLNRGLRRGVTPPLEQADSFTMRVPPSYAERVHYLLNYSDWQPILYRTHRVERGDSFARIAARHNISTAELIAANPRNNPRLIHPGELLNIPFR